MTITDVLNDLSGVIHGTTINKIPNVYGILNRAARAVLSDVDPKETQRIVALSQVFNSVYDYALPTDVKGDRIIDIRPQAGRVPSEVFSQQYAMTFDSQKILNTAQKVYIQHNTGVKTIRIEAPTLTTPTVICDTSTITGWSNITPTLDTTNNVAGGGAIVFDLPASSPNYIEFAAPTTLDLSSHKFISTLFVWTYIPTGSGVTSINLRWGSSSSDYYSSTVTTTQQGSAFQNGWNLLAFDWVTASTTGTPDATAIDYLRVTYTTNSVAQTGVKLDNFTSNLGAIFEIQYYSKYLFRNPSTNAFQETVAEATDGATLINLDTESYNLFFNKVAFFVAQSLQGADAEYDAEYWNGEYQNALAKYKALNPSEAIKKAESYYKLPRKSYNRFSPGMWRR